MQPAYGASGVNHDFNFFNSSNQVWNGTAFANWSDGSYASYRVAATEVGSSGQYPLSTPPANATRYELRERGASLALSPVVWQSELLDSAAQLDAIAAKTALIGTGTAFISSPVNGIIIQSPLVINDNYLVSLDNAFEFVFVPPAGAVIGSCSCSFGGKRVDGPETWLVTGNLEDLANDAGEWKAIYEMTDTETAALVEGFYNWSAQFSDGTDTKTIARGTRVKWVARYTDP